LLESHELPPEQDSKRLSRLALLNASTNAEKSWDQLTEAYSKNPRDSDVRSFRGQIFESVKRYAEARVEYVAAHVADPTNPIFADQLAEFYIRRKNYPLAVATWCERLESPSSQFIWMKTMFWCRVTSPKKIKWLELTAPRGDYSELLEFVRDLPTGTFWNDDEAQRLIGVQQFLNQRQEVYWLQLLQLLKDGKEEKAQMFMEQSPFRSRSWHPELESRLVQTLEFRLRNQIKPRLHVVTKRINTTRHSAFLQLENLDDPADIPPKLKKLLDSGEAFSAILLAGGWLEAALQLRQRQSLPDGLPDWYVYGIGQAMRMNRSPVEALAFLQRQTAYTSPLIRLQVAELRYFTGDQSAIESLEELAKLDDDVGFRAAFILCGHDFAAGKTQQVRQRIGGHPKLRKHVVALEMAAATFLMEDRNEDAERIYKELGERSTAALKYLMRKAFNEQDWQTAEEINNKLLKLIPDSMQLRQNVLRIEEAKKKTS
jgi:tetratricopeptide (TPR) repeat protein